MADQKFNVSCGFFDSVNGDRLYSADQMNKPYFRLISNGIFAAPDASPSEDFEVVPSSGMGIIVKAGNGIFADKWLESAADIAITVPSNNSGASRKDSVIIQVDKTVSGRSGSVVYRTGGQSFPDINTDPNIVEYRVANLTIPPLVSAVAAGMIDDLRGSECPWIKSLLYQPDNAARIDEFIASYGVSNGTKIVEDVLWSSSSSLYEPPQISTGVELAHSMADYEYIDIRYAAFGKTGIVRFKPADISAYSATADHLSHFSEFERNVQVDTETQSTPLVKIDFMVMKVSNTRLTWSVAGWVWDGKDSTSGKATKVVSTASDPIGLLSVTGTKYEEAGTAKDPELADIRVGVGGVTYPTAGDAVRAQIAALAGMFSDPNSDGNISIEINFEGGG